MNGDQTRAGLDEPVRLVRGIHDIRPVLASKLLMDERHREIRRRVRTERPLVHCLTNAVTVAHVADSLAAMGALPVMASAVEEVGEVVQGARALLLNLGTPTPERWRACRIAGEQAMDRDIPIVLDPVGCGLSVWRTREAEKLVERVRPAIVRGNAVEVAVLAGLPPPENQTLRGITVVRAGARCGAGAGPAEGTGSLALAASRALGYVCVVSGTPDAISNGVQVAVHPSEVPLLGQVVGGGDILGALIAACRAVEPDSFAAAQAGLQLFAAAARLGADRARGPGTFWPAFIDALASGDGA